MREAVCNGMGRFSKINGLARIANQGESDNPIFMKVKSITVTEAARNFADCLNRSHYQGVTFVLLKMGSPLRGLCQMGKSDAPVLNWPQRWNQCPCLRKRHKSGRPI